MRVQIVDGTIVVSLENKIHDYLDECRGLWSGYYGYGYLKIADDSNLNIHGKAHLLGSIINLSDKYGVEVDDEARHEYAVLAEEVASIDKANGELREKYRKMERWAYFKEYGCNLCTHCKAGNDEDFFVCTATFHQLPMEDIGLSSERANVGNHYFINALFCLAPFPTTDCPYKTEDLDKTSPEYLRYREMVDSESPI